MEPFPRYQCRQVTRAETLKMRNTTRFPFLETRPQVKHKEKSALGWALHHKLGGLMPRIRYGWNPVRPLPWGKLGSRAWSRFELRSTCLKPWGDKVGRACWRPASIWNQGLQQALIHLESDSMLAANTDSHQIHFHHKLHPHFCNFVCIDFLWGTSCWVI